MKKTFFFSLMVMCLMGMALFAAEKTSQEKENEKKNLIKEIKYQSSADKTMQPAMFYKPDVKEPRPLLVALHTWSHTYQDDWSEHGGTWCVEQGWGFIFPNFRGANNRPEATGSDLVIQDILDAVEYAKKNGIVDERRIYLMGHSGGGYVALLMAGRAPDVWAGVSAWVPISDLKAWHIESKSPPTWLRGTHYWQAIETSCGGDPAKDIKAAEEAKKRSPITYLKNAKNLRLDINAGIHDGHDGSVPISHTLNAFNILAEEKDRLTTEEIEYFVKKAQVPPKIKAGIEEDDCWGKKLLFRRQSGLTRVTIFDGGHEINNKAALTWLAAQQKNIKKK
ncbi:MAG: prolyl oligopeptidase family serine peptidase [Planctomycetota bacterium]